MANATRVIKVKFDASAKGLIAAAKKGSFAIAGFEKQLKKSVPAVGKSVGGFLHGIADGLVNLPKMVSGAFSSLPSEVKLVVAAAGAAVGVAFAGAAGAAIVAGVLLAVGGGVLAAGIAKAVQDPRVKAAWAPLGASLSSALDKLGSHFVGPLERAAAAFKPVVDKIGPMADRLGAIFAPIIDKLSPALAGMAEKILPAIEKVAIASAPLFTTLAEKAPKIADAIVQFFGVIERNAPAANQFFGRLLDTFSFLIGHTAKWIELLARVYGWFEKIVSKFDRARLGFGDGNVSFGNIPGRAKGGPVTAGRSYLVGEQRPEIFTPRSSGYVTPTAEPAATAAGTSVEVHVHVSDPALRDLIQVEIVEANRRTVRALTAGAYAR